MFQQTQAIVINTINYNDKYILATLYTESSGRVTYMVSKSRSRSSKIKKNVFLPLAILDINAEHLPTREIQRIREIDSITPLHSIQGNLTKTSIVFFLSEFLTKVLRDADEFHLLFPFLRDSIRILEESEKGLANYHLVLMLKLTRFLGFYPNLEDYKQGDYFDLLNGVFVPNQPLHNCYINSQESNLLSQFARINFKNMGLFRFSRQERSYILTKILDYYRIHLHDFQDLKSLDILHELF